MLVPAPNWPRQLHRPNFPGVSRLAFVSGASILGGLGAVAASAFSAICTFLACALRNWLR